MRHMHIVETAWEWFQCLDGAKTWERLEDILRHQAQAYVVTGGALDTALAQAATRYQARYGTEKGGR